MNEFTTERSMEAASPRWCLICHEPIVELKKAQWLPVGLGLRLVAHDTCMEALLDTAREAEQAEREVWESVDVARELASTIQKAVKTENLMRKHYVHE